MIFFEGKNFDDKGLSKKETTLGSDLIKIRLMAL